MSKIGHVFNFKIMKIDEDFMGYPLNLRELLDHLHLNLMMNHLKRLPIG